MPAGEKRFGSRERQLNLMIISNGVRAYEWIDDWGEINGTQGEGYSGRTHGAAATREDFIVIFRHGDPAILILDQKGKAQAAWGNRFAGAHGLTLVEENNRELLWLTDTASGEVVKTTLEGETLLNLEKPERHEYATGKYVPTWVAVNETRFGGNGDIWLADGYGQSLLHRFNSAGEYMTTLNGANGAGRFACPHGIWFDPRKSPAELYVADRTNRRVQIFDAEGNFLRVIGENFLTSPCSFALDGDELLIPELKARLSFLDGDEQSAIYLGENNEVEFCEGYPNSRALLEIGKFHAPHHVAADSRGDLYMVEWIIGGRVTKLVKQ